MRAYRTRDLRMIDRWKQDSRKNDRHLTTDGRKYGMLGEIDRNERHGSEKEERNLRIESILHNKQPFSLSPTPFLAPHIHIPHSCVWQRGADRQKR